MAGYLSLKISNESGVSIDTLRGTIRIKLAKGTSCGCVRIAIDAPEECLVLRDELLQDYEPDWEKAKLTHDKMRALKRVQKRHQRSVGLTPEQRRHFAKKRRFR